MLRTAIMIVVVSALVLYLGLLAGCESMPLKYEAPNIQKLHFESVPSTLKDYPVAQWDS